MFGFHSHFMFSNDCSEDFFFLFIIIISCASSLYIFDFLQSAFNVKDNNPEIIAMMLQMILSSFRSNRGCRTKRSYATRQTRIGLCTRCNRGNRCGGIPCHCSSSARAVITQRISLSRLQASSARANSQTRRQLPRGRMIIMG